MEAGPPVATVGSEGAAGSALAAMPQVEACPPEAGVGAEGALQALVEEEIIEL